MVGMSELLSMYRYNINQGSIDPITEAFPVPVRYLEKSLGFSEEKQRRVLRELLKENIIQVFSLGRPRSRHVSINFERLALILQAKEICASNAQFYEKLTKAANKPDSVEELEKVLDNTKDPLRASIKLLSVMAQMNSIAIEWTPKAVGQLKSVLSTFNKASPGFFDYRRLATLGNLTTGDTLEEWVTDMIRTHKQVNETPPKERIYSWTQMITLL